MLGVILYDQTGDRLSFTGNNGDWFKSFLNHLGGLKDRLDDRYIFCLLFELCKVRSKRGFGVTNVMAFGAGHIHLIKSDRTSLFIP